MLKLKLSMLFGEDISNGQCWYCVDETTNKFYKKTIISDKNNITETIEEVCEEQVENWCHNHPDLINHVVKAYKVI